MTFHHWERFTLPIMNICVTDRHWYVPFLGVTTPSFLFLSWLVTGFLPRVTRRMSLVKQGLLTLTKNQSCFPFLVRLVLFVFCFLPLHYLSCYLWLLNTPFSMFKFNIVMSNYLSYIKYIYHCLAYGITFFSRVYVTRSLVLCVCFVDRCLSFCAFSFGHCAVCSSIYGFWLPRWYLQTLLIQYKY
jgi:hypothetical protein